MLRWGGCSVVSNGRIPSDRVSGRAAILNHEPNHNNHVEITVDNVIFPRIISSDGRDPAIDRRATLV